MIDPNREETLTSLDFTGPDDLSVGHVRIQNERGVIAEWVATPDTKDVKVESLLPGLYSAEISPAGVRPQTYVFEVKANAPNTVVTPSFSAMVAGANTGLINHDLKSLSLDAIAETSRMNPPESQSISLPDARRALRSAAALRTLSIGLCKEAHAGKEDWEPYDDGVAMQVVPPGIELSIPPSDLVQAAWCRRVRLSLSVQNLKVQRLLLPIYLSGTTVAVTSSPLSTVDVSIQVTPTDNKIRAIYRALDAGTPEIVEAVKTAIIGDEGLARFLTGPDEDPWAALMCALLMMRFPETFGDGWVDYAAILQSKFSWAYDAHIIAAKALLANAPDDQAGQESAAKGAIKAIARALELGSPYYTYANQLTGEILNGIASLERFEPKIVAQAQKLLSRWQRYLAIQSPAGGTFAWLKHEVVKDKTSMLQPFVNSTGVLNRWHSRIVFRGQASLGKIFVEAGDDTVPKSFNTEQGRAFSKSEFLSSSNLPEPPGLQMPIIHSDDPNKGRFGGSASNGGFSLNARFEKTRSPKWVRVTLIVSREKASSLDYVQKVLFYLHPTFAHDRVETTFRGSEACITVTTYGGFTAGAWIPDHGISLECDLSELSDAPEVIREL